MSKNYKSYNRNRTERIAKSKKASGANRPKTNATPIRRKYTSHASYDEIDVNESNNKLIKILAECGVAARRNCEKMILNGRVRVNNNVIKDLTFEVGDEDEISVDRQLIKREDKRYFALYKPRGVVSTTKKIDGKRIISSFFEKYTERLFYAGRLDADSQGLMIITNDGTFANIITHPSFQVHKTYEVVVAGKIDSNRVLEASKGFTVNKVRYAPFKFKVLGKGRQSKLRITINEGKNREIRNIFEALGHPVVFLERIAIGIIKIHSDEHGTIEEGKFRELTHDEIEYFYEQRRKYMPQTRLQNAETLFFEKPKIDKKKRRNRSQKRI